ncbi:hypothetical protein LTR36_007836 [Oleoguttula mirabilis]|uniref:Uncharacterized protein n=1 Tax=Oleoguttula mirabilis TaxID=1507867 RepID=A0AAV9J9T3_9PEZI|nr:hypothetical protein LTR36_007836 [Oleoguttula mirabilis]
MSTAESTHYIYTLTLLDQDTAGQPTISTWRAFEHLSDAIAEANLWWTANRFPAYGTATVGTHNTEHTPEQALYRLESNEENFWSRSEVYRRQVVQVARVWLDVDDARLKTVMQREAIREMERERVEREAEKDKERTGREAAEAVEERERAAVEGERTTEERKTTAKKGVARKVAKEPAKKAAKKR